MCALRGVKEGSSVPDRLECILQASTDLVRNSQGIQTAAQKKNWWKVSLEPSPLRSVHVPWKVICSRHRSPDTRAFGLQ